MPKSPIEQEIIDGLFYWDNISPTWFRLVERKTMDVVGHYKCHDIGYFLVTAVAHQRYYHTSGMADQQGFQSAESAREWIEQNAKDHWLEAPHA